MLRVIFLFFSDKDICCIEGRFALKSKKMHERRLL
jgi:hypothetical protein